MYISYYLHFCDETFTNSKSFLKQNSKNLFMNRFLKNIWINLNIMSSPVSKYRGYLTECERLTKIDWMWNTHKIWLNVKDTQNLIEWEMSLNLTEWENSPFFETGSSTFHCSETRTLGTVRNMLPCVSNVWSLVDILWVTTLMPVLLCKVKVKEYWNISHHFKPWSRSRITLAPICVCLNE